MAKTSTQPKIIETRREVIMEFPTGVKIRVIVTPTKLQIEPATSNRSDFVFNHTMSVKTVELWVKIGDAISQAADIMRKELTHKKEGGE